MTDSRLQGPKLDPYLGMDQTVLSFSPHQATSKPTNFTLLDQVSSPLAFVCPCHLVVSSRVRLELMDKCQGTMCKLTVV